MLKANKGKLILSSIITLLPVLVGILFWNDLPDTMAIHWGTNNAPDGFSSKAVAVFLLPCILLALHWLCLIITQFDKKQQIQNKKALNLIFWIMPATSLLCAGTIYFAAFGTASNMLRLLPILFGVMFLVIGNYLPKVKQNQTLGIKLSWTMRNEENWNKTHRLGGKIWFIGGLVILAASLLPVGWMLGTVFTVLAICVITPTVYSYQLYLAHKKAGIIYPPLHQNKTAFIISIVSIILILSAVLVIMFTGNIQANCTETALIIDATYAEKLEIPYQQIESVEYRKSNVDGHRVYGFGSAKLLLGTFENEEFGSYTRYTYTGNKPCIVLTSDDKVLVINCESAEKTEALYNTLIEKAQ